MSRRASIVYAWICIAIFAFPHLWNAVFSGPMPLSGLKNLLTPFLGSVVILLAAIGAAVLTLDRFYNIENLFFWSGAITAVGFTFMWVVGGGAGITLCMLGLALGWHGRRVMEEIKERPKLLLDSDAPRRPT